MRLYVTILIDTESLLFAPGVTFFAKIFPKMSTLVQVFFGVAVCDKEYTVPIVVLGAVGNRPREERYKWEGWYP